MTDSLVCTFTAAGLAALANAQGTGLQAVVSHLAVGRGQTSGSGFVGYAPVPSQTALKNETIRAPLITGTRLDPAGFRVLATVPASSAPDEYWIREVAAVLSDGVLLAIWSDPLHPLSGKTSRTDVELAYDLLLEAIPSGLLAISVLEPDIPDTTGVLAALLRGHAQDTTHLLKINERLIRRGI